MYADDTVILTQHKNLENSITDQQISLDSKFQTGLLDGNSLLTQPRAKLKYLA